MFLYLGRCVTAVSWRRGDAMTMYTNVWVQTPAEMYSVFDLDRLPTALNHIKLTCEGADNSRKKTWCIIWPIKWLFGPQLWQQSVKHGVYNGLLSYAMPYIGSCDNVNRLYAINLHAEILDKFVKIVLIFEYAFIVHIRYRFIPIMKSPIIRQLQGMQKSCELISSAPFVHYYKADTLLHARLGSSVIKYLRLHFASFTVGGRWVFQSPTVFLLIQRICSRMMTE